MRISRRLLPQLSIAWQLPQYVVITCGEILFSVTGLEFAYQEAPRSMKAVVQAFWLLTVTVGRCDTHLDGGVADLSQATERATISGFICLGVLLSHHDPDST